ncbi:hypothetical protein [Paenibacillus agaridevorans]|uniref:hypothetical protein n=1 Tax=Paenibacillus agaridevorans TaxID=171404 RepID=UPI0015E7E5AA|nr:hypothetical protein [Paenibacillus agaridevorans]
MHSKGDFQIEIRRLYHQELFEVLTVMKDVISRLLDQELFAMDDEDYFLQLLH